MSDLTQTIIITGANRGIGLGLCQQYLIQGWHVVATHRPDSVSAELQSLSEKFGAALILAELDVCDELSIQQFGTAMSNHLSHVSVLINNAGVSVNKAFGDWDQALFLSNFKANLVGPALVIQALSPLFDATTKVIQISTGLASLQENIGADEPFDGYAISKIALNLLTKRLANKLQTKGSIFCSISPGWVNTDMGGPEAPTSVTEVSVQISQTIEGLTTLQSGSFVDCTGTCIPW
jgi:NAD(P)-dependent dehydrogenase (short-subunit alcohol dehydrogenase family)